MSMAEESASLGAQVRGERARNIWLHLDQEEAKDGSRARLFYEALGFVLADSVTLSCFSAFDAALALAKETSGRDGYTEATSRRLLKKEIKIDLS